MVVIKSKMELSTEEKETLEQAARAGPLGLKNDPALNAKLQRVLKRMEELEAEMRRQVAVYDKFLANKENRT